MDGSRQRAAEKLIRALQEVIRGEGRGYQERIFHLQRAHRLTLGAERLLTQAIMEAEESGEQ